MPITYKLVIPSEGQSNRMEQPSDMGLLIQKVMERPWQHPKRTLKAQFKNTIDKKVTQEGQNTKDYVRKVLTNTSFKYLGISFLLTYHYILWFIPDSFFGTELLNDQVTEAWLVNLLAGSITMLFTAFAIKRGTHLSDNKNLAYGIPVGLALCSVTLQYLPGFLPTNLSMYVLACVAGGLEGLMLILWGECLTRMHAQFSMPHIGMVFSGTLFVLVLIGLALPTVLVPMFTAALVVVSGMLLVYEEKQETRDFPVLLPKSTTKPALSNAIVICFIGFLVGAAYYYLAAIIPWENLPLEQSSFVVGVITMGACFFVASAATNYLKQQYGIFKMFPWFLVLTILAFCLFIADGMFSTPAFLMSLVISCVLEISLLVYFGILVKRDLYLPRFYLPYCYSTGAYEQTRIKHCEPDQRTSEPSTGRCGLQSDH